MNELREAVSQMQTIAEKLQRGESPSNGEGTWLLARARNCAWALGKITRKEPITPGDIRTVLDEFDYMPVGGEKL